MHGDVIVFRRGPAHMLAHGMMWNLARDYVLYANLFKRKGDLPKVKENLNKAIEIFYRGRHSGPLL